MYTYEHNIIFYSYFQGSYQFPEIPKNTIIIIIFCLQSNVFTRSKIKFKYLTVKIEMCKNFVVNIDNVLPINL